MKTMKLIFLLLIATFAVACGQADKTFKEQITVEKGIKFGDGTIQLTAPIGAGSITWDNILFRPLLFPPIAHTHDYTTDLTNKPGTIELNIAISQLLGVKLPVLTTVQINALTPTAGTLVYDNTLNVLKIYVGNIWKIVITSN